MRRDFDDILASVAVRVREQGDKRFIEESAFGRVSNRGKMSNSRSVVCEAGNNSARYVQCLSATHAYNRNCASSRCCGNRGNRVVCAGKGRRAHSTSGESKRLAWLEDAHTLAVLISRKSHP